MAQGKKLTQYDPVAPPELDLDDIIGILNKETGKWRQTSLRSFLAALNVVTKVNGKVGEATLNTDDLSDEGKSNKFVTKAEKDKIATLSNPVGKEEPFSEVLKFDWIFGKSSPAFQQAGPLTFSIDVDGNIPLASIKRKVIGDGVNPVKFSAAFSEFSGVVDGDILEAGKTYSIYFLYDVDGRVSVNMPAGSSSSSNLTALSTPSGFAATVVSSSQVNLTWGDVANESNYRIRLSTDGGDSWITEATLAAGTVNYSVTGLSASTAYIFELVAIGDGATYSNSLPATIEATTQAASSVGLLAAPSLSANGISTTEVKLDWASVSGANNYIIERATERDFLDIAGKIQVFSGAENTFTDSALTAGTAYYYRIKAQDTTGASEDSNWVTISVYTQAENTTDIVFSATKRQFVTVSGNNVSKFTSDSAWDGGALSTKALNGPGAVIIEAGDPAIEGHLLFGLSYQENPLIDNYINFPVFLQNNGQITIYENGLNSASEIASYVAGDLVKVEYNGTDVRYYKSSDAGVNWTLLYTSAQTPVLPMYAEAALRFIGGRVLKARFDSDVNLVDSGF